MRARTFFAFCNASAWKRSPRRPPSAMLALHLVASMAAGFTPAHLITTRTPRVGAVSMYSGFGRKKEFARKARKAESARR